ncbi:hypothetical protein SDC9_141846 [bioreactor metagenome]|uniref:Uncharacterized protein n=1 Tax=bioreactor metagenome TaxID=1076179 RepID=A0A645DZZ1_9ZZZZ
MQRDELAIDVGQADLVVVKQVDGSDTRAGNRLRGITANAADAKDGNARGGERLRRVFSDDDLHTGEFIEHMNDPFAWRKKPPRSGIIPPNPNAVNRATSYDK